MGNLWFSWTSGDGLSTLDRLKSPQPVAENEKMARSSNFLNEITEPASDWFDWSQIVLRQLLVD